MLLSQHGPCCGFQGPQVVVQRAGAVLHALEGIQAHAPGRSFYSAGYASATGGEDRGVGRQGCP